MNPRSYHSAILLRLLLVLLALLPRELCLAAAISDDPCCGTIAACPHADDMYCADECPEEQADRSGDESLPHTDESPDCGLQECGCCGSFTIAGSITVASEPPGRASVLSLFRQGIPIDPQSDTIDHPPC